MLEDLVTVSRARMIKWSVTNKLSADHPGFMHCVHVSHEDGSTLMFCYAFTIVDPENDMMIWVFTQSLGFHVLRREEVMVNELSHVDPVDMKREPSERVH